VKEYNDLKDHGKSIALFLVGASILFGLYLTSLYSYLLFHSLAEIFSIVVASSIFVLAWNSRRFLDNNYLLLIGIAYLFVGSMDLLHTLAYKGMGIFQEYDANLPTQLWIATRYVQSLSLVIAPAFFRRKIKVNLTFLGYTIGVALLLGAIFGRIFPDCYIEGEGLTPFKKISEYVICLILLASTAALLQNRQKFDKNVLRLLVLSILATIASELAFTFYISVYGLSNLIGHLLKIVSFYLVYKAIVETSLVKPYNLLFRNLKQSETALRESEKRFRTVADFAYDWEYWIGTDGRLVYTSPSCERITGYGVDEFLHDPKLMKAIVHPDDREIVAQNIHDALESDDVCSIDFRIVARSGEERWLAHLSQPVYDADKNWLGRRVSNRDITKRKQVEETLRQRTVELQARNEELDAFSRTVAHDLKNPLGIIVGFAEVLQKELATMSNKTMQKYLHLIAQSGRKMNNIIEALLLLAQVSKTEIKIEPLNMAYIVDEVLLQLETVIKEHQVEIVLPDTWPEALGYGPWVEEVWINYLSNAIKYGGQPPHVELGATVQSDSRIRFWVRDNGSGLTPEAQARLFTPFTRLGRVHAPGHGLGLSIVQRIVEKLDGQVGIESQVGQGSVFTFTLLAARSEQGSDERRAA